MNSSSRYMLFAFLIVSFAFLECAGPTGKTIVIEGPWEFRADRNDAGLTEGWAKGDSSSWTPITVPGAWEGLSEYASLDGIGWYRTNFKAPDGTDPWSLYFEGVDDDARVWLNGSEIGSHVGHADPFILDAGDAARPGENTLVVRVVDHAGPGGIYRPVRVVPTSGSERLLRSPFADREARPSADWVRDAVIYEVYLRSFSSEGSLKALEARLPELKDLGVTVLWLMPIHPVGELNRKGSLGSPYAVHDFYDVNPEFGTKEDLRSLVRSAHAVGLTLIIDLVANHTAWDNPMLLEHPEWFTTNEDGAIVAPNPDWTDVADLNYEHHELRKYMLAMMRHWVGEYGIDGFRCDVSELVPTEFWETARRELEKIKPVMMLSEGTLPEHHLQAFDLTYSWTTYDILEPIFAGRSPASLVSETIRRESNQYPKGSLRMRFSTNHDKNAWDAPAVTKFGVEGAKLSAALMFTLPGVPLIYNGEEAGNEKRLDLFEKVDIDWSRDRGFRDLYRQLTRLRQSHPWLSTGTYVPWNHNGGSSVLAFARSTDQEKGSIVAVFNFADIPVRCAIDVPKGEEGTWKQAIGAKEIVDLQNLPLPARGFIILEPTR